MGGILVVDDDKEGLRLLRCVLEGEGFKAHYASSGEEAIQKLMAGISIAIMITDLNMPEMDGIELAMLTKEISPHTTIVMMTGDTSPEIPQMAADAGISKVLAKPFSPGQLLTIVRGSKYFVT
ncbi:response regulator [Geobacter argillaceus]|uniref:ATP-dependent Lon protease/chemosensory pili system protein ChpA (Sensor histidine kinase/response regulator)/two-component system phosphate regulon response regulator OmpR n=1 Tax=Geobacter argillaceus TaxID=345631 RepID=A0A562VPH0_9BACT|nr:response regulator [Geobacter argillaceus]TWJ19738.1 ATP-dependent Lon protease/chemosensory pili system protein ChpA (sensor histidine kinase/response regulator)/two-component system phosphate regulon response regulator OmpR [Geobacter argillaceus]